MGYEPRYPYPLIVFFHGRGGSERQLTRLAPRLSRRNYICLGLRGPELAVSREDRPLGFRWDSDTSSDELVEECVFRAIEQARRTYHIHSERIFLAGFCEGAAVAYRLGLTHPDKFAGIIALNGQMPAGGPALRLPEVKRLPVLISHGLANAIVPLSYARSDFRLLYTAGLPVRLRTYLTTHRLHADMLGDIDRWIMEIITSEEV
jgi:phospholipase/carboxylesterase